MSRNFGGTIAFLALLFFVSFPSLPLVGQQSDASEPYSVVHGWPQLPSGSVLGQVSGVAVDSHNHVFVFHRAENSWAADKSRLIGSPTVLCFDAATGKLQFSWGANRFVAP